MEAAIKLNRKFGYTVATALLALAAFHIFIKYQKSWYIAMGIALLLLLLAFIKPIILNPLRLGWDKIGHVLGIINTYVLLTLFYFLILAPLGLIMRLFGKDILKVKLLEKRQTYWENTLQEDSSMTNQF